MKKVILPLLAVLGAGMGIVGCDTATPNSPAQQVAMRDEARVSLEKMYAQDPSLKAVVDNSVGYVVFPSVGEAAVGVGAASGWGYVYQGDQLVGKLKISEGSLGPQVGGATFGELIIFKDQKAFNRIQNDSFEFGSDASAQLVKAGAAGSATF